MTHASSSTGRLLRSMLLLVLFAMAILSSIPASAKTASAKKRKKESAGITLEQFRKLSMLKGSRKIEITPVQPAKGIATGGVIAYGHFIRPPYKVEYADDRLLINGIQVSPSLVKERDRREHPIKPLSPEKQAIQGKVGELMRDARKIHEDGKWWISDETRHQKIMELLRKHADIVLQPQWHGEELCYTTPVYKGSSCEGFGPSIFSSPKVQARLVAKNKAEEISGIERLLTEGAWVCFGSTLGGMGATLDPRAIVNEVMKNPTLSRDQKIELLEERAFRDYDLALDVVDNYSATEWAITK